ncbi:phosphopantetheine-binding protein [Microbulbifer sp. A4B17]|uniref:phosphopantetheine-binding protein n=1 Tax=unclassified Microbulbifer TaxID=2619833 RepID=UPI000D52EA76|nr:phosphopantetheine-binding protein [Microbulbifer sp. A4B17]AWF79408.1 acyl carrier protein [Microbulbifer sp. A4B17]WNZ56475.1 phosphopantetheine-binding protein [Microbulbifer sp. MKSA007]
MKELVEELKVLIIDVLNLEDITPEEIVADEPLFGEGLGLDSIDALELGLALQKKYNISIDAESEDTKSHFANVNSLANFVSSSRA